LAAGDFNGDGIIDLVTANHRGNDLSILLGKGDGTFGTPQRFRAGLFPAGVAVADFNRDGRADIAVANHQSNDLSVLLAEVPTPHFRLTTPQAVVAGGAFNLSAVALDALGNLEPEYTSPVRLVTTDPRSHSGKNAEPLFVRNGVASIRVSLNTVGVHTVRVESTDGSARHGSTTLQVIAAGLARLHIDAPNQVRAGEPFAVVLFAADGFDNPVPNYMGMIRLSCDDPDAQLPKIVRLDQSERAGVSIRLTLKTPGTHTLTAAEGTANGLSTKATITVAAPKP
jgi:hypothetical protein